MKNQTQLNPVENWRYPTLIEQESEIEWLYPHALFPVLRCNWELVCGRGRIKRVWPDKRLVVAMSKLGHEAEGCGLGERETHYYRRIFCLLPRDVFLIRSHLQAVCAGYRTPLLEMPTGAHDDLLPSSMDWVSTFSVWPGEEHRPKQWQCYERMAPYYAANLAFILTRWHLKENRKREMVAIRQRECRERSAKSKRDQANLPVKKRRKPK